MTLLSSYGCDLSVPAAQTTAKIFDKAAPAIQQYWDYQLAGDAMPGGIVQLEGILRVIPDDELVLMNLAQSYCGYAYGWVEDRVEVLEAEGNYSEAEVQRSRVRLLYLRARDLINHLIAQDHDGMDAAVAQGLPAFEAWLADEFDDEDDAEPLFWLAYSWAMFINNSLDDMDAVADIAFVKAVVTRSVQLDPTYYQYGGTLMLAVLATQELGADLDAAQVLWEEVLEKTERRALLAQVNMANFYAVKRQDRTLYVRLLTEVLEAGDINPEQRLANRIAKHRAARYLRQVNERF